MKIALCATRFARTSYDAIMCGRITLTSPISDIVQMFDLLAAENVAPRYNIAPTQNILAIRQDPPGRHAVYLKWGLVPSWANDPGIGSRLINARSESLAEKPAFRSAFRHHRCLIPADAFYEWQKQGDRKQPFLIHRHDKKTMALAGLWEHWQSPDGSALETCTIITTQANATLRPLHDRMPVILERHNWAAWLDPTSPAHMLQNLLQPAADTLLTLYPVTPRVNNPALDDPSCIHPADPPAPASDFLPGLS